MRGRVSNGGGVVETVEMTRVHSHFHVEGSVANILDDLEFWVNSEYHSRFISFS